MAGHSRSKNDVAPLAYAQPSTSYVPQQQKAWMPAFAGMTAIEAG
jgi:hypothetical protein